MTRAKSRGYIFAMGFTCRDDRYRRFARLWIDRRAPGVLLHSRLAGGVVLPDGWREARLVCGLCPNGVVVEHAYVLEWLRNRIAEGFPAGTVDWPVWSDMPVTHRFPASIPGSSREAARDVAVAAGTVEHRPEPSTEVLKSQ
ncbi:MAG: hypothetical protein ACJ72N_14140 [Labedaea sp.]